MSTSVAEVLRHFGEAYLAQHCLSSAQAQAWRAIVACRTAALGGQLLACGQCGAQAWHWHACRNRHCPRCQHRQREAWRRARIAELLDVPYAHLVFTLPHALNPLAGAHPRWLYDTLMRCAAATLKQFAADPRWLGGIGSFTLVLHTWTQDLRRHVHVHALMACGALATAGGVAAGDAGPAVSGGTWLEPRRSKRFLFPVRALSQVFRAKFLDALDLDGPRLRRDPQSAPADAAERRRRLLRHDWVVYAKTPLAGPAAVLDYLSRYTHRTAIGNERLVGIRGEQVLLRVRADSTGGKRVLEMPGTEFIGRFLQHVLPVGFKRIRHYGLLAPAAKAQRLATARSLLHMPQPDVQRQEDARAFMQRVAAIDIGQCPHCKTGRWQVIETVAPQRRRMWPEDIGGSGGSGGIGAGNNRAAQRPPVQARARPPP